MNCLVCDNPQMTTYLDLGEQPLANTYPSEPTKLPTYPLSIQYCNRCWHSQLAEVVDPDLLFKDYAYVSGTSQTLNNYFDWFVQKVEADFVGRKLRVLDIAGNDGTLLEKFQNRGHTVLNIDPAENLTQVSIDKGVPSVCAYWPIPVGEFDVIIAMNVLAHVQNPREFLVACREALAPGGRVYVQTSQCDMLETGEFDAIYHEHVSYFSPYSFEHLVNKAQLDVLNVQVVPVHGGSFLGTLGEGAPYPSPQPESLQKYKDFGKKAHKRAAFVKDTLDRYQRRVVGFGAAAKANTFINFSGIRLEYIVDESHLKYGNYTPGSNTFIESPDALDPSLEPDPLLIVITAWNFYDEIYAKIKAIRDNPDDLFCRYFPTVEICH